MYWIKTKSKITDVGNFGFPLSSFHVKKVTQDPNTNKMHVRYTIVVILLVGSNIDLHCFTGPHKNSPEQSEHIVPIVYKTINLTTPMVPADASLRTMPPATKDTISPTHMQISQP